MSRPARFSSASPASTARRPRRSPPQAVGRGRVALVCERELERPGRAARRALGARRDARASRRASTGIPSRELTVVGVTGTNGKTTTAHLLAAVFDAAGLPAGILGTVGNRVGGRSAARTRSRRPRRPTCRRCCAAWSRPATGRAPWRSRRTPSCWAAPPQIEFAAGRVHEPVARAPRLPPRHRRLLRRQAPALPARRRAATAGRRREPRRRVGRRAWPRECADAYGEDLWTCRVGRRRRRTRRSGAAGAPCRGRARRARHRRGARGRGLGLHAARAAPRPRARASSLRLAARFNVENALTRGDRRARARPAARGGARGRSRTPRASPGASRRCAPGSPSRCSSTTRTPPIRSRTRSGPRARVATGRVAASSSAAAATATAASAR